MTNTTFLLNVKTSFLSSFNYRKMRTICTILLTALVFYTVLFEESELIISKLSLRCMLFVFAIFSIDLYLRGMGFMGSAAYIAAMLIIICTNDNHIDDIFMTIFQLHCQMMNRRMTMSLFLISYIFLICSHL